MEEIRFNPQTINQPNKPEKTKPLPENPMNLSRNLDHSLSKLMVVDDESSIRDLIVKGAKNIGCDCVSAHNGEEALRILSQMPIDVVISDINMPGMDGLDLMKTIKEQYHSDVIMMTGFTKDFTYENVIVMGASDFISKPLRIKELNLRIQRVLRERKVLAQRNIAEAENEEALKKLKKAIGGVIYAMAMTIEIRDPYTAGHQRRVANLSRAIGRKLELSPVHLEGIGMAGVVHDLGKISIPSEILCKPGKLSDIEFSMIKTHPKVGYEILKAIDFPWPLAETAFQHHERLDGSGYPMGLREDEIILEAKIVGVADVVEAMASHRPYRPAVGIEAALDFIIEKRGIIFDASVVDACISVFRESNFQF
jgi:response regulator RpfG family c-di-GMP phosphodiesterase